MGHIHLIGIGGAGLSAIATVLLQQGYRVSGSDMQHSANTKRLQTLGATVMIGHSPENLANTVETVVISSAIPATNPELVAAYERGLTVQKRSDWLGQMMEGHNGIAIAGTHGKTTTTSMAAYVMQTAGYDPTFIVGGYVPQLETNAAAGSGQAFIIEADEYDHMFLGLRPKTAVVTTVEWDHPDIFPTAKAVTDAFEAFVQRVPEDGQVIVCDDDMGAKAIAAAAKARVITYGLQPNQDWQALNLRPNSQGAYDFEVVSPSTQTATVSLQIPGKHNVQNALAVLAIADQQGLDLEMAAQILSDFQGVDRRFQLKGEVQGVTVIEDYAHHPTEIRTTLAGARIRFDKRPLWVVAQPHTFSRTLTLLDGFASAFDEADHVILLDIFAAREVDEGVVSSQDIVNRMSHPDARHIGDLEAAVDYLVATLKPEDVLLTFGAGNVYLVGERVLIELDKR